jgi:hypothetical protein
MIITGRGIKNYNRADMKRLEIRYFLVFLVLIFTAVSVCDVQGQGRTRGRSPEKSLFGKHRKVKTKETKVREPRSVRKAKETQAKKEEKLKKEYRDYVSESKKRAVKIQSPEVQARMKQNQKDITAREKNEKKKSASSTKKGQKKYKK